MKINSYTINTEELESLAISSDIPFLGDIATIKQIGEELIINLNLVNKHIANEIEFLISSRYPGINIRINQKTQAKTVQPNVLIKKNINNIIAISSGKGGVGKSSTATCLALAIAADGAKVGILDADIYGPSQPTMLGINKHPKITDNNKMLPNSIHGIESNSIGYLVDNSSAMIWRAPMIIDALKQLMNDTLWGSSFNKENNKKDYLDYLIIDLPPGTGDISISLAQEIPITGAITVTTPQDISLIDARRSLNMFKELKINNLGIIENMSSFTCESCNHKSYIFDKDGGKNTAIEINVPFLGDIPIDISLRKSLDIGNPLIISQPKHSISKLYREIAQKIIIALAHKTKNFSNIFGEIIIENK